MNRVGVKKVVYITLSSALFFDAVVPRMKVSTVREFSLVLSSPIPIFKCIDG